MRALMLLQVDVDGDDIHYPRTIVPAAAGNQAEGVAAYYGILLARTAGLPEHIISRAMQVCHVIMAAPAHSPSPSSPRWAVSVSHQDATSWASSSISSATKCSQLLCPAGPAGCTAAGGKAAAASTAAAAAGQRRQGALLTAGVLTHTQAGLCSTAGSR